MRYPGWNIGAGKKAFKEKIMESDQKVEFSE